MYSSHVAVFDRFRLESWTSHYLNTLMTLYLSLSLSGWIQSTANGAGSLGNFHFLRRDSNCYLLEESLMNIYRDNRFTLITRHATTYLPNVMNRELHEMFLSKEII